MPHHISSMSINVDIPMTIPLDIVASIKRQARDGIPIDHDVIGTALGANIDTIIDSIIAIPYDITPRNSISAVDPKLEETSSFEIFVRTLAGKNIALEVTKFTSMLGVAERVHAQDGLLPHCQRLILDGKIIFDGSKEHEDIMNHITVVEVSSVDHGPTHRSC